VGSGKAESIPRVRSVLGEVEIVLEGWSALLTYYMSRQEPTNGVHMRNHGW
jgi:hypothetical protein